MMTFTSKAVFWMTLFQQIVQSAADITNADVTCTNFTYSKLVEPFNVCYSAALSAMSSTSLILDAKNNTVQGPEGYSYSYAYTVYDTTSIAKTPIPVVTVAIGRSYSLFQGKENDMSCTVQVNDNQCTSCSYCGNETYTVDCTNIDAGRKTKCESNAPLFFPLTKYGLPLALDMGSPNVPTSDNSGDGVQCSNITYTGLTKPFQVCYKLDATAISGTSMYPNGTQGPSSQAYNYNFAIYKSKVVAATKKPLFTIGVARSGLVYPDGTDKTKADYIKVAGIDRCKWYSYCGGDKYSADCTNLLFGRKTTCESIAPVFFPFTKDAITSNKPITRVNVDNGIRCSNVTYSGLTKPFQVCYKGEAMAMSSTSQYANGTQGPSGEVYKYNYTIYKSKDPTTKLFTIGIGRSGEVYPDGTDTTKADYIKVVGIAKCKWYQYCGKDKYSADCTNLLYGRKATCESITPLFFPFTKAVLINSTAVIKKTNRNLRSSGMLSELSDLTDE